MYAELLRRARAGGSPGKKNGARRGYVGVCVCVYLSACNCVVICVLGRHETSDSALGRVLHDSIRNKKHPVGAGACVCMYAFQNTLHCVYWYSLYGPGKYM